MVGFVPIDTAYVAELVQVLAAVPTTVYVVPVVGVTTIEDDVEPPGAHTYPTPPEALSVVDPPGQTVDEPETATVGVELTTTVTVTGVLVQGCPSTTVIV